MAKKPTLDDRLTAISRTRRESLSDASIETLRSALREKHGVLVEHAARAAAELLADPLAKDLAAAFERCLRGEIEDRSFLAMTTLADALQVLRADEPQLFLRGLQVRKPIPPNSDAAAGVRSACAFGLVRCRYHHDLWELASLLHDPIPECRTAAARAMGMQGTAAAMPLLKYKVIAGDRESDVIVECLSALMSLGDALALPFVAERLDAPDEHLAEAAALALGESRRPDALPELTRRVPAASPPFRRVLLLSVGLLRSDASIAYLLDRVEHADPATASDAIRALVLYQQNSNVKSKLAIAVDRNSAPAVRQVFAQEFR